MCNQIIFGIIMFIVACFQISPIIALIKIFKIKTEREFDDFIELLKQYKIKNRVIMIFAFIARMPTLIVMFIPIYVYIYKLTVKGSN